MAETIYIRPRAVLAFDPGPKQCGWAVAGRTGPTSRPYFIDAGNVSSELQAMSAHIKLWVQRWPSLVVAVEQPGAYIHDPRKALDLLNTKAAATSLEVMCRLHVPELPRVSLTVQGWRRQLCPGVNGTPGDAAVKHALGMFMADMPKRTNVHMRDALGLACVVLLGQSVQDSKLNVPALPPPYRPKKRRRR